MTNDRKKIGRLPEEASQNGLRPILEKIKNGELSLDQAENLIRADSLINVGDLVSFDSFRESRSGIPEVVFSESKPIKIILEIIENVVPKKRVVLFTRLTSDQLAELKSNQKIQDEFQVRIDLIGRLAVVSALDYELPSPLLGPVGILTAGTSDIVIAKEAMAILELMGVRVLEAHDLGIAGLHRLISPLDRILSQDPVCIIVLAGMEGALPSVVAGLVDVPVIGVPISTGYGFGGKGVGALTSMLQSCAPGLAVVNIDGGFPAGAIAGLFAKVVKRKISGSSIHQAEGL